MKKLITLMAITGLFTAATAHAQKGGKLYGKKFSTAHAQTPAEMLSGPTPTNSVAVEGKIAQVCQAEGCWLKLKNESGEDVMVRFKGHSFFVPKDIAGKQAIVYGAVQKRTISVAERKHMAEDAGATEEMIAKITEPKDEVQIQATGVIVK